MPVRKLKPRFLEKEWGATRLTPWFPDAPSKIGEVWFEGSPEVPLLVKFLFTTGKLSVQVHPQDDYAEKHHKSRGKTEMWHILAAEPGAKIAAGFREPCSEEQARSAALSGEIEQHLEWFDANPGDTFFIPAGTVHAIGAGLALCEIQQHSDVTYRLYDYGRPRKLHLEHGFNVSKLERHDARKRLPVSCPYFVTEQLHPGDFELSTGGPQLLIAIEGRGSVEGQPLCAGEVLAVQPADEPVKIRGELKLLRTFVPG